MITNRIVSSPMGTFMETKRFLAAQLLDSTPIQRGQWQSSDVSDSPNHATYEISPCLFQYDMPPTIDLAQRYIDPDLPWAEDHFQERISGQPLNPPPSEKDWPYHGKEHGKYQTVGDDQFDHTYPERFWPKRAGVQYPVQHADNLGIRYGYGDLSDVIAMLQKNSWTRQAYLPVWFPEDTGAVGNIRVPCTLGYHFLRRGQHLDCNYFIRSCDIYRHFTNDVYMTVRLAQYVYDSIGAQYLHLGMLNMFISNLHLFRGDAWRFE